MPIPFLDRQPELSDAAPKGNAAVLITPSAAAAGGAFASAKLLPRALAHFIDVGLVTGFSFCGANFFATLLLAWHARAVPSSPHTRALFRAAFEYAQAELFAAGLVAFGLLYFVALPLATRKTFGLSLLGLELRGEQGGAPSMRQLTYRLLGCTVQYATMGLGLLSGLGGEARFLSDRWSGTRIVKSGIG